MMIQTVLDNGYLVSTIERDDLTKAFDGMISTMIAFVGDVGRSDFSTPGKYETMVFPDGEWHELDFKRYDTVAEAESGHAEMVAKWTTMPSGMAVSKSPIPPLP